MKLKYLKRGTVAKFREYYNRITKPGLNQVQRNELLNVFKKENITPKKKKT